MMRLNTPDGGLQACLTLGRVPQQLADYMTGDLGIDALSDLISYVKFDTWEQEVESKIIALAIVAKAVTPEKQNIALARLRTAWKAGWEAIKSSGARGADASSGELDEPLSDDSEKLLQQQWKDAYPEVSVPEDMQGARRIVGRQYREWNAGAPSIFDIGKIQTALGERFNTQDKSSFQMGGGHHANERPLA